MFSDVEMANIEAKKNWYKFLISSARDRLTTRVIEPNDTKIKSIL